MTDIARIEQQPVTVTVATLKYLGYDPDNIATHALVALAKRYQLDPLLGEIQLISDSKGRRVYITRDGMLEIAHRSGHLDGIVVEDERRSSADDGWTAYVSVYRNDMSHPFTYGAQCKDKEPQAQRGNGPEMALTRAERRALKRAFRIRSDYYPEHPEHGEDEREPDPAVEPLRVDPELSTPKQTTVKWTHGGGTTETGERWRVDLGSSSASSPPVSASPGTPTPPSATGSGETPQPIDVEVTRPADGPNEYLPPEKWQLDRIRALLGGRGKSLDAVRAVIPREIRTLNDLWRHEADAVIAALDPEEPF